MKRNLLYIISLALVVVSSIIMTVRHSPFGRKNTSFASSPEIEINKIVFSGEGKELVLENSDGRWLLNEKLETRKSSINYILKILREMSIKSPVSPEYFDTAVMKKSVTPVRIKTYENGKMLNDFLVYKTPSNIYGNVMKKGERAKPFIVYVPGFENNIGNAFTMNELYWQPYTIFNLLPSEIISVDFENLQEPEASFSILKDKGRFALTHNNKNLEGWDSTLVRRYLTYFTFIPFESWASDLTHAEKSEIISAQPSFRIDVKTSNGQNVMLTLWERTNQDGTRDTDRLWGKTDAVDELFIVRYFDIDPVIKKKEYFFTPAH